MTSLRHLLMVANRRLQQIPDAPNVYVPAPGGLAAPGPLPSGAVQMSDGLIPPLNAPPAATPGVGVQPGVSGGDVFAQALIVYEAGGISGIFIYSGIPGSSDLIGSWTANGGTDPYDTPVPAGLQIGVGTVTPVLITQIGGQGQIQFINSGFNNVFIYSGVSGAGTSKFSYLAIQGPTNQVAGFTDSVNETLNSASSGAGATANKVLTYNDANGTGHAIYIADCTGLYLPTVRGLAAVQPGTGTSSTNAAQPEGWHPITCAGGWTLVKGPYYKLLPNNMVYVYAAATHAAFTTSTQLSNTTIDGAVTNQGYWPFSTMNIGGPNIPGRAGAEITAAGLVIAVPNGVSCTEVDINGTYPLDL